MDNFFEIGDLGIVRDIPLELTQLQSTNKILRTQLQRQISISNILKVCLIATIIYVVVKASPFKQKEE